MSRLTGSEQQPHTTEAQRTAKTIELFADIAIRTTHPDLVRDAVDTAIRRALVDMGALVLTVQEKKAPLPEPVITVFSESPNEADVSVNTWTGLLATIFRLAIGESQRAFAKNLGLNSYTVCTWTNKTQHGTLRQVTRDLLNKRLEAAPPSAAKKFLVNARQNGFEVVYEQRINTTATRPEDHL